MEAEPVTAPVEQAGEAFPVASKSRRLPIDLVFSVADQALISAANLGVGLLVMRTAPKAEYGLYGIGYVVVLLLVSLMASSLSHQMTVRVFDRPAAEQDGYAATMLFLQASVAAAVLGLVGAALLAVRWLALDLTAVGLGMAPVLLVAVAAGVTASLQDFFRTYFYLHGAVRAFCVDLVHVAGWILATVAGIRLAGAPPHIAALAAYGLAGLTAGALGQAWARLPLRAAAAAALPTLRETWSAGRWSMGGVVISFLQGQAHVYLLGALSGSVAVADVNAARLLLAPLTLLLGGVGRMLTPRLARLHASGADGAVRRLADLAAGGLLAAVLAYGVLVLLAKRWVIASLFPPAYRDIDALIVAWVAVFALQALATNRSTIIQVHQRFRALAVMLAWTAAAVVGLNLALIPSAGSLGSLIALACGQALFLGLLHRGVRGLGGRPA